MTRTIAALAMAVGFASIAVSAAYADPPPAKQRQVCIRTSDIQGMSYPDDKTILFRMSGGPVKVWRNDLPRTCPGLKFEQGIAWNIWGGEVCSNMQVFYVLHRGTPCMLGNFTPQEMRGQNQAPPQH